MGSGAEMNVTPDPVALTVEGTIPNVETLKYATTPASLLVPTPHPSETKADQGKPENSGGRIGFLTSDMWGNVNGVPDADDAGVAGVMMRIQMQYVRIVAILVAFSVTFLSFSKFMWPSNGVAVPVWVAVVNGVLVSAAWACVVLLPPPKLFSFSLSMWQVMFVVTLVVLIATLTEIYEQPDSIAGLAVLIMLVMTAGVLYHRLVWVVSTIMIVWITFLFLASVLTLQNVQVSWHSYVVSLSVASLLAVGLHRYVRNYTSNLISMIQSITKSAEVDPLTGIYNRRGLVNAYLELVGDRSLPVTMCLTFVDVDKLKHINDTYGHVEGDDAIVRVSRALRKVSEEFHGSCYRYAGDEFVLITPCPHPFVTPSEYCTMVSDRLSDELGHKNKNLIPVTATVGLPIIFHTHNAPRLSTIINMADEYMYHHKRAPSPT